MINYKLGDRKPDLVVILVTEAGYSLAGKTVSLRLTKPDGTEFTRACTVLDDAARKVSTEWEDGDFDQVGEYKSEYVVDDNGLERTVPARGFLRIRVNDEV